ncbi:hypothetical protein GCM10022409_45780 [Hymenobacter glaciei]|uniref:DUF306 domain-containing protein n=1 Tax=Hymenobacter glaciei TaxID=877209 RepID=A0ABP7UVE0_9BACT
MLSANLQLSMNYSLLVAFLLGSSVTGCQPATDETPYSSKTSATTATTATKDSKGNLHRLAGTWVGRRKDGFDLLKIKLDSTGTYTTFIDRNQTPGLLPDTLRYFLYESPVHVTYTPRTPRHQATASVLTCKFRFDYNVEADTLIEIDKMGVQGKFIRVRPEH